MGYRSTVAYTIRFETPSYDKPEERTDPEEAKRSFYTFIGEAKAKETTAGAFTDEDLKVDEEKLAIYFFAESVKWYEDYPDVKCHECLMGLAREWADDGENSNPFIGGAFARIGEETDDNIEEVWGNGEYDWVNIYRSMHCDWMD
jgi:hypothetical protein